MNNIKYLWIVVAIVAVISIVAFFNGKTITQVIQNPLGSVTSPYMIGPELCVNGLCTYVAAGDFKNSTTTIVSFANPYNQSVATSTIDLSQLYNTGVATSTYTLKCGASYAAGSLGDTQLIISTSDIATSTNFKLIQSGMDNTTGYKFQGQGAGAGAFTTASSSIAFGPTQYFVCKATFYSDQATHAAAFVGTGEAFDGNFRVRIIRGY